MMYLVNNEEVTFITFRTMYKNAMIEMNGNLWLDEMADEQVNNSIDSLGLTEAKVCINDSCFQVVRR